MNWVGNLCASVEVRPAPRSNVGSGNIYSIRKGSPLDRLSTLNSGLGELRSCVNDAVMVSTHMQNSGNIYSIHNPSTRVKWVT